MQADMSKLSLEYLELTNAVEKRMKHLFVGSVLLSVLAALDLAFLRQSGGALGHIVGVSFTPVMLWSLTMTGYAFYSLWRINSDKGQMLGEVAATDPRTGVKSLSYIKLFLQKEYERAIQTGQPTAVLYVDLQNLDLVNERFGHTVGDIVLRSVAKTIEESVPEGAVVAHVAGDEFVVVLPATKPEKAKSVSAGIQKAVAHYSMDLGNKGEVDFLGCSTGIIACPQDAGFAEEMIGMAQKAARTSTTKPSFPSTVEEKARSTS